MASSQSFLADLRRIRRMACAPYPKPRYYKRTSATESMEDCSKPASTSRRRQRAKQDGAENRMLSNLMQGKMKTSNGTHLQATTIPFVYETLSTTISDRGKLRHSVGLKRKANSDEVLRVAQAILCMRKARDQIPIQATQTAQNHTGETTDEEDDYNETISMRTVALTLGVRLEDMIPEVNEFLSKSGPHQPYISSEPAYRKADISLLSSDPSSQSSSTAGRDIVLVADEIVGDMEFSDTVAVPPTMSQPVEDRNRGNSGSNSNPHNPTSTSVAEQNSLGDSHIQQQQHTQPQPQVTEATSSQAHQTNLLPSLLSRFSALGVTEESSVQSGDDGPCTSSQAVHQQDSIPQAAQAPDSEPSYISSTSFAFNTEYANQVASQTAACNPWSYQQHLSTQGQAMEAVEEDFKPQSTLQKENEAQNWAQIQTDTQHPTASTYASPWVQIQHAQQELPTHISETPSTWAETNARQEPQVPAQSPLENHQNPWVQIETDAQNLSPQQPQISSNGIQNAWVPMNYHAQASVQQLPQAFSPDLVNPHANYFQLEQQHLQYLHWHQQLQQNLSYTQPLSSFPAVQNGFQSAHAWTQPPIDPSVAALYAASNFWNFMSEEVRQHKALHPPAPPIIINVTAPRESSAKDQDPKEEFWNARGNDLGLGCMRPLFSSHRSSGSLRGSRELRGLPRRAVAFAPISLSMPPLSPEDGNANVRGTEANLRARLEMEKRYLEKAQRLAAASNKRRRDASELCPPCSDRVTKRARGVHFDRERMEVGPTKTSSRRNVQPRSALKRACEGREACKPQAEKEVEVRPRREKAARRTKRKAEKVKERIVDEQPVQVNTVTRPQTQRVCPGPLKAIGTIFDMARQYLPL